MAWKRWWLVPVVVLAGCSAGEAVVSEGLVESVDERSATSDGLNVPVNVGSTMATTANLNLRTGPGVENGVRLVMPKGARVTTVNRSTPDGAWYNVKYNGLVGWAHGGYLSLVAEAPSPSTPSTPAPAGDRAGALARAKSGVGFSYWWGHGAWAPGGLSSGTAGACTGSCPNCSHVGRWGADCSGYLAKLWQVPSSNADLTVDAHPYSTATFVGGSSQWRTVGRGDVQPADALVYNDGTAGHTFLYESGDGWGSLWSYEARGCSYGIVHNLRTAGSAYKAIARY